MHTKVHTIYLHVFPELQLQHALLVFEFQLSRPARETSISWVLSVVTLYVIMRTDNKRHFTVKKKDWLLALWGQPVTAVFWCEICSVYHVTCIQMLCCITCMTRQTFTPWNKEWTSEAADLRHHEFRLLGNQCILFMNELDPLFDHIRRTAAFCKENMVHIFFKKTGRCAFFGWGGFSIKWWGGTRFICSIWHSTHVSVCLQAHTLTCIRIPRGCNKKNSADLQI